MTRGDGDELAHERLDLGRQRMGIPVDAQRALVADEAHRSDVYGVRVVVGAGEVNIAVPTGGRGGGARRGGALPPAGERPLAAALTIAAMGRARVVVRRQAEAEDGGDGPRRDSRRRAVLRVYADAREPSGDGRRAGAQAQSESPSTRRAGAQAQSESPSTRRAGVQAQSESPSTRRAGAQAQSESPRTRRANAQAQPETPSARRAGALAP
jgi:hypothetical protein